MIDHVWQHQRRCKTSRHSDIKSLDASVCRLYVKTTDDARHRHSNLLKGSGLTRLDERPSHYCRETEREGERGRERERETIRRQQGRLASPAAPCMPSPVFICGTSLIHMRDIDTVTCATWLRHMCDMPHSHVSHASITCVKYLSHMCAMMPGQVLFMPSPVFISVTWPIQMCDMTHSYM